MRVASEVEDAPGPEIDDVGAVRDGALAGPRGVEALPGQRLPAVEIMGPDNARIAAAGVPVAGGGPAGSWTISCKKRPGR